MHKFCIPGVFLTALNWLPIHHFCAVMTDSSTALVLWRMRMRLMNVDRANSSVLARPQAYKIPIYIQTCTDEMLCGKMEMFIALMGHQAKLKAHAAVFFSSNWDNVFQMLKQFHDRHIQIIFTFTCKEICKTSRHLLYLIPWVIFLSKNRNVIACLPKPSQFDGGVHLCKKLCDWHVTWAYACDWSEQLKVESTGCCVHGKT